MFKRFKTSRADSAVDSTIAPDANVAAAKTADAKAAAAKTAAAKTADAKAADAKAASTKAAHVPASIALSLEAREQNADSLAAREADVSPVKPHRSKAIREADEQLCSGEEEGAADDDFVEAAPRGAGEGWGRARRQRQRVETRAQLLDRLTNPPLSLHEAGILLGVCPATVRRYCDCGRLPHERTPGGQRRFRLHEVLNLMREMDARRLEKQRSRPPRKARRRVPARK